MLSFTSCIESTVVLSARGFTQVPKNLSENLVSLDLSNNNITTIAIDDFRTLKQVKAIDLSYNQIQTLHERSFEHVYCLQELDLSHNKIVHLPHSIFSSNQDLKKLYLKKNMLQFVGDLSKPQHILDSESLIYLDLSFCNITYISCDSLKGLPNLQTLITEGNPLTQQNVEIINPTKFLRTMKTDFCNSSIFEKSSSNLQEQSVETTSSNVSLPTEAKEKAGKGLPVVEVSSILCAAVFIIVVTSYFLITICKNWRAKRVAIQRLNSLNAILNRPLPALPFQDCEYEVPITPSNECISSVTSSNLQLKRNCGYVPLPSTENDSLINTGNATRTYHVSMESNHASTHSLSSTTEYQDNVPYPTNVYIYSYSNVTEEEEEEEEENSLPLPPVSGNYSISTSSHFSGANQPSTTGIPVRPCRVSGCPQDDGYLEKMRAPTRPTPTSPASPTRNVTTFSVKKINSQKVYVSSISIEVGQGS